MNATATRTYSAKIILERAEHYGIHVTLDLQRTNVIVVCPGSIEFDVLFKALDVIRENKEEIVEFLRGQ